MFKIYPNRNDMHLALVIDERFRCSLPRAQHLVWSDFGFVFNYFSFGVDFGDLAQVTFYPDKSSGNRNHRWPLKYGVEYGVAPWVITAASAISVCFDDGAAPDELQRQPKLTWFSWGTAPKNGMPVLPPTK
jgi:hypothetical protein